MSTNSLECQVKDGDRCLGIFCSGVQKYIKNLPKTMVFICSGIQFNAWSQSLSGGIRKSGFWAVMYLVMIFYDSVMGMLCHRQSYLLDMSSRDLWMPSRWQVSVHDFWSHSGIRSNWRRTPGHSFLTQILLLDLLLISCSQIVLESAPSHLHLIIFTCHTGRSRQK